MGKIAKQAVIYSVKEWVGFSVLNDLTSSANPKQKQRASSTPDSFFDDMVNLLLDHMKRRAFVD
jgi:hypothetical protein